MAKIRQLDKAVAEKIAAGEVVERPASVAKELVENAIDAGATAITVEIENGGMSYLRIADNGSGIEKDDVPTAFLRHATSKITNEEDLFAIGTLGFRGEALAAVAAVSRLEMLTKTAAQISGTHIAIAGGGIFSCDDAGCPDGTTIIVRDLFYNTPARLKFMKRDATEAGYVASAVLHAALSSPEVSVKFIKNGKVEFHTPGDGNPLSALYAVYGGAYTSELLPVQMDGDGVSLTGYITKPESGRSNRSMQTFFVNGRYVHSRTIGAALEEAYKERIMVGRYPGCLLYLSVSPVSVDVNIHPAKTEIKFSDERRIFSAVYRGARLALDADPSRPEITLFPKGPAHGDDPADFAPRQLKMMTHAAGKAEDHPSETRAPDLRVITPRAGILVSGPEEAGHAAFSDSTPARTYRSGKMAEPILFPSPPGSEDAENAEPPENPQDAGFADMAEAPASVPRVVGEIFGTYILVEDGEGMLVIDKHAAHERIRFNRLSAEGEGEGEAPQLLLEPQVLSLRPDDCARLLENAELLDKLGFLIEPFGTGTLLVRQVPAYLPEKEIIPVIAELSDKLKNGRLTKPEIHTKILERISCVGAIKAGSFTSLEERELFVKSLLAMPEVKYCPHGRPVMIRMTRKELEKAFGRIP